MAEVLKKFGRYFLLDKIAQGGMAEIYRARLAARDGAGRLIVIKRMSSNYGGNAEFLKMFKSEIKVTMGFNHPNIAQLYDYGEEQNQPYIAMEFVDGKNLRQFISRSVELKQHFPVELAAYIIEQSASGLHYAHTYKDKISGEHMNIVHRDISPQNILISYDGAVKVIDFGIAKANDTGEATKVGIIKGKPSYLSPEQITGEGLDARCDIFALGIVLWELLAGRKLFAGDNDLATIKLIESCQNHVVAPSTYNAKIPKELDYIVLKALAKNREKRHQTADELQRVLHKFLYSFAPEFNPSDLSFYTKDQFKDDIVRDRKRVQELSEKAESLLALADEPFEVSRSAGVPNEAPPEHDERTVVGARGPIATGARVVFEKGDVSSNSGLKVEAPHRKSGEQVWSNPHPVDRSIPRQNSQARRPRASGGGFKVWLIRGVAASALVAWGAVEMGYKVPWNPSGDEATLVLEGDNKGVSVEVNREVVGSGLPLTVKKLRAGKVSVRVRSPAGDFIREVVLKPGESRVLPVDLPEQQPVQQASGKGVLLHLNITPGGGEAAITINGKPVDMANPVSQQPLDKALELIVKRNGFKPFHREFVLQSQQIGDMKDWSMDVQLEPISYGFLTIHTTPPVVTASIQSTALTVDGKPWVRKTPIENEKIPTGVYNIHLTHEVLGMEKTITVTIEDQKVKTEEIELKVKE